LLAQADSDETDEGLAAARAGLARLCLATREIKPVEEMLRYVVAPDGQIVPDLEHKLPGRGAWVAATRAALEQAVRDKAFARAFRGKGAAGAELPELTERLLDRAALEALSLANKAGQVVTGFAKVENALAEGNVAVLLHARDAAANGVGKLNAVAAAAEAAGKPAAARIYDFRGEQLDLALGRSNVVHAALLAHPASRGFLARCLRLERWRTGWPAGEAKV
jgi:predicted RNA-binding protein YlxR (DUF448 family)